MKRRSARLMIVAVLAASFIPSFSQPASADTFRIRAAGSFPSFNWDPSVRRIHRNDRIRWVNNQGNNHNIRAYGGNWRYRKSLGPGTTRSRRFRRRGTFKFRCAIHSSISSGQCSGMCGRIRVRRHS
jgi:plastocyanin